MKKQINLIFIAVCLALFALTLNQTVVAQQSPIVGTASTAVVRIDIYSYTTKSTITYSPYTPSHSGYIWAYVDIQIANTETDNVNTNSQYASIKDSQNNVYTAGTIVNDPQALKTMDLSCGNSARGNLYFEIPATANIVSFTWDDNTNNLVISAGGSTASPTPPANPTPTPTIASTTSPGQTPTATSSLNPTMSANTSSSQSPAPSATIPEFPQTIMLLAVTVMFLIVSTGLVSYRRHNSFAKLA